MSTTTNQRQGAPGLAPGSAPAVNPVESYSDVALQGAINGLINLRVLDTWGEKRLALLQAEKRRRRAKRRGEGGA